MKLVWLSAVVIGCGGGNGAPVDAADAAATDAAAVDGALPDAAAPVDAAAPRILQPRTGSADPSFGSGGVVTFDLGSGYAAGVVVQPSGRIVAGVMNPDGAVVLHGLAANGDPDPTFGSAGLASAPGALQGVGSDGALFVASGVDTGLGHGLARLLADGSSDASYPTTGRQIGYGSDRIYESSFRGYFIDPEGRAVFSQDVVNAPLELGRLTTAGAPDASFGTNDRASVGAVFNMEGYQTTTIGFGSDGSILVPVLSTPMVLYRVSAAGVTRPDYTELAGEFVGGVTTDVHGRELVCEDTPPGTAFLVEQLTTAGTADSSVGGALTLDGGGSNADCVAIAATPSGGFAAGGTYYDPTGAPLGSFVVAVDAARTVQTLYVGTPGFETALAVQPDGAIVTASFRRDGSGDGTLFVSRYLP